MIDTDQLILPITPLPNARFATTYAGENQWVIDTLKGLFNGETTERFIYLHGLSGAGRTHLLQACCAASAELDQSMVYLSLAETGLTPAVLDGLDSLDCVAIDDLDAVIGDRTWEEALFNFFNRRVGQTGLWLLAGLQPPKQVACCLPDWQSRLSMALVLTLAPWQDADKMHMLQAAALERGMQLSDEVAHYILKMHTRQLTDLMTLLGKLDQATLANQRRLTIPFVRSFLAYSGASE